MPLFRFSLKKPITPSAAHAAYMSLQISLYLFMYWLYIFGQRAFWLVYSETIGVSRTLLPLVAGIERRGRNGLRRRSPV